MNKYQEALKTFKHVIRKLCALDDTYYPEEFELEEKTLQGLVDKATPKKPIRKAFWLVCPNCDREVETDYEPIIKYDFCPHCGQAVNWSNDEPTK